MYRRHINGLNVEKLPKLTQEERSFAEKNLAILRYVMEKHNVFGHGSDCGAIQTFLSFIQFWMLNSTDRGKLFAAICYIVLDTEIGRYINQDCKTVLYNLSPSYFDIIRLYANGKTRREIAGDLGIPYGIVKSVLQTIAHKIDVAYFITKA